MAIQILSGPLERPQQTLIFGVEGIGKTTLVSEIAKRFGLRMLFIDTEYGTRIPVDRTHVRSMSEWDQVMEFLLKEKHNINCVTIDTITSLEPFVETDCVLSPTKFTSTGKKITRMGDFEYGKGSIYLREAFDRILYMQLDELVKRGISVILVGHAQVSRTNLPELIEGFDRYELAMDKKVAATLRQWVDNVLFCNWDFRVTINDSDQTRGIAGKERVIYAQHAAAYDAKNRAGLPEKLKWDPGELAPLFSQKLPESKPQPGSAGNGQNEHRDLWVKLLATINAEQWKVEELIAFFKSRFPAFNRPDMDWNVIPLDYIKRAIDKPQAFITTINEFIAAANATKTQSAESA